jgi:hypothetical protein
MKARDGNAVKDNNNNNTNVVSSVKTTSVAGKPKFTLAGIDVVFDTKEINNSGSIEECFLTTSYEKVVNIFGQFKQESIALGLSELR